MITFTVAVSPAITFTTTNGGSVNLSVSYVGAVSFTINSATHTVPSGGTDGQVLAKISDDDYDYSWVDPSESGGAIDASTIADGSVSNAEFQRLNGVSSNIQDQITNHVSNTSNPHSVTKSQVGLGNVDNTSDANKPISDATQTALNLKESTSNKDANNGYCGLDSGGKVPIANLPTTLLQYESVWNAATNTPTLTSPDLTKVGKVYTVTGVSGSPVVMFSLSWKNGDWLVYNSSGIPEKSDNSDDVTSVNGQTGVVNINASDLPDFDTEVSNNSDVSENTSARHEAVTVSDTDDINLTLSGQQISASLKETAISSKTLTVTMGSEEVLINDNGTLKKTTVQDIAGHGIIMARMAGHIMY